MKAGLALLVLGVVALNVDAQLFQPIRTKPSLVRPVITTPRPIVRTYSPVRYNPYKDDPSRYRDDAGQYRNADDGRYIPDDSGKYVHIDPGYKHIEGAHGPGGPGADPYKHRDDKYRDANDRYKYAGGDKYVGDSDAGGYKGDKDGQGKYKGTGDAAGGGKYRGSLDGAGNYRGELDNSGKYIHKDEKYKHIDGAQGPNGPGAEKYKHVKGPDGGFGAGEKYKPEIHGVKPTGKAILHKCKELDPEGYTYEYNAKVDPILGAEDGALQYRGTDKEAMCAVGFYNYIGKNNEEITTYYIADELGYRPVGDHLHPQIRRLLKHLEETHV